MDFNFGDEDIWNDKLLLDAVSAAESAKRQRIDHSGAIRNFPGQSLVPVPVNPQLKARSIPVITELEASPTDKSVVSVRPNFNKQQAGPSHDLALSDPPVNRHRSQTPLQPTSPQEIAFKKVTAPQISYPSPELQEGFVRSNQPAGSMALVVLPATNAVSDAGRESLSKEVEQRQPLQPKNENGPWLQNVPRARVFNQYQEEAMQILDAGDYMTMGGKRVIKKTGWRKLAFFFNISFEIRDSTVDRDVHGNVLRASFLIRATMPHGRFCDATGSCDVNEKRFSKPNNDIPATAETRAKNRCCQDLLGVGECKGNY